MVDSILDSCSVDASVPGWAGAVTHPQSISRSQDISSEQQNSPGSSCPFTRSIPGILTGCWVNLYLPWEHSFCPSDECTGSCEHWAWPRRIGFKGRFCQLPAVFPGAHHYLIYLSPGFLLLRWGLMIYQRVLKRITWYKVCKWWLSTVSTIKLKLLLWSILGPCHGACPPNDRNFLAWSYK